MSDARSAAPETTQSDVSDTTAMDIPANEEVGSVYERLRAAFVRSGSEAPALEARLLLAQVLGCEPGAVHRGRDGMLDADAARRLCAMAGRRLAGEPVYRIIGRRPFYEHEFRLGPDVLEPRPDTECLVTAARTWLDQVVSAKGAARFVDIGTGSGAIGISLLALVPQATCIATDIAEKALSVAAENALDAGVSARFEPVRSDYCAGLAGPFDCIVSNPPYIATADLAGLAPAVRDHDPRRALDGGPDGLDAYRAIAAEGPGLLAPHGRIVLEIGAGMDRAVEAVLASVGFILCASATDLGGICRVLVFRAGDPGREKHASVAPAATNSGVG